MTTEPDAPEGLGTLLDRLVAEYSDRLQAGEAPPRQDLLERVPPEQRPELERCLRMIELGIASAPAASAPIVPGTKLGRYRIERELGRGGMALVFLARDEDLRRPVALKVLRPGLALERRHVDRFEREALAVAKLDHPNVVKVWEVGETRGWHWLAMEYVDGPSLATLLQRLPRERQPLLERLPHERQPLLERRPHERRPTRDDLVNATGIAALAALGADYERVIAALVADVAGGLAKAHALGIVHRDVKPSNLLVHRDGRLVLADFGLAKEDGNPALSLSGDPIGTPSYMAPEQAGALRDRIDGRTDVYALGVVLFEAWSGRRPFEGDSVMAIIDAIRTTTPPGLRAVAPHASRDAEAIVDKAMQREPERRYASAAELAADLRRVARGEPTEARHELGGRARRTLGQVALALSGLPYEYRSPRTWLGVPLVHVRTGRRGSGAPARVARGWLAIGDVALGGVALGQVAAVGAIAVSGVLSLGVFTLAGALSVGLALATAGCAAIGGAAFAGGFAAGYVALAGGMALGIHAAVAGGFAWARYALAGGSAKGEHVISETERDPEAVELFGRFLPWLLER